jgi:hypothetical protein
LKSLRGMNSTWGMSARSAPPSLTSDLRLNLKNGEAPSF